jgi:lipopolysaccharide transport system permease protein
VSETVGRQGSTAIAGSSDPRASWIGAVLDAGVAAFAMWVASGSAGPGVTSTLLAAVLFPFTGFVFGLYASHRFWPIRLMLTSAGAAAVGLAAGVVWKGFNPAEEFRLMPAALLTLFAGGTWRVFLGWRAERRASAQRSGQLLFDDRAASAPPISLGLVQMFRYRELLRNLVLKDLKLKYRGSALGFMWSLANPLAMLVVYSVAFTYILGLRRPGFVFFLFVGLLAWTFFASTISMATGTIADAGGLLKSVRFPRTVMPVATVLFNLAQYLMTFGVLLPVMLAVFRVPPAAPMLAYPIVLALLVLFTSGLALMVATANVYYRDVRHLVEVALQVLFWVTPIMYDLGDVPARLRPAILLSPMSPFISALHDIFYRQVWPDAAIWMAAASWTVAAFVSGLTIFLSYEDRLAEQL